MTFHLCSSAVLQGVATAASWLVYMDSWSSHSPFPLRAGHLAGPHAPHGPVEWAGGGVAGPGSCDPCRHHLVRYVCTVEPPIKDPLKKG